MKAWKMVDLEHADAVAKGSMLIAPLADHMRTEAVKTGKPADTSKASGWAYCLCEPGATYSPDPARPQAIFEIEDLGVLSQFAMARMTAKVFDSLYDVVSYHPTALKPGDPFAKDPMFAAEKEIRLIFRPPAGGPTDGPILIRADYTIAGLVRRVA